MLLCVQEVLSNFAKGLAIKIELLGHLLHAYINHANRKRKITDKKRNFFKFSLLIAKQIEFETEFDRTSLHEQVLDLNSPNRKYTVNIELQALYIS